ncbi:flavin-containing monooxygenase [Zavarzinia aquatilis]|uniref:Monooxygenase n=1 Tax=Zavarzinia aquatilis TaxID=2211142 RepID=A0A317EE67_9PROT|nr:NAD(P)/FAD-dependent oxidoreductase [Zavarzinia aquatilis]PWR25327.1 monooxygenase [Zavarzinia aquatilis]
MSRDDKGNETVDLEAIRRKYREERDRRLRAEGNDQYVAMSGQYARYLEDPYVEPGHDRAPVTGEVEAVIVGGGFGGLLSGARLRLGGVDDFLIVEKAGDFGGTWYWNRYPGAACDTESYVYLPLLEETGYMPVRKYAKAPEILEHSRRVGRHFGLYDRALFQTAVTAMRWCESEGRWHVETSRKDVIRARFVILAGGGLHLPKLPGIPGIETFKGHSFHTSRWDYEYTGGSSEGGLDRLADKRVGLIGTGATAVQCVPHLGASAKEFFVLQRTPSAIGARNDRPTDPEWARSLHKGWQRQRMDNFTAVISGGDFDVDLVNDGWTEVIGEIVLAARRRAATGAPVEDPARLMEIADIEMMERIRARVDAIVRDPATAEALKPWYGALCKRPCFHDGYLQTFNRPNVHLVDTRGRGVERVTEQGVVVAGREYALDCLIFATGFEVGTDFTHRMGFEIHGRDGLTLSEKWQDGAETMHGFFVHGFPNFMIISPTQSGQSANFQHMLDEQSKHVAYVIQRARALNLSRLEPSAAAEKAWVDEIIRSARGRQAYLQDCTPGYYNNEGGGFDLRETKNSQYWRGPIAFVKLLEAWREDGGLKGLECA